MENTVNTALLTFSTKTKEFEIPWFRGAVISMLEDKSDTIFHNHMPGDEFKYNYPLVQYKSLNGKAAILLINEAITDMGHLFSSAQQFISIGKRKESIFPVTVSCESYSIEWLEIPQLYTIKSWIPLNSDNYAKFKNLTDYADQIDMLEHILVGNIISCLKGLNIFVDFEIEVQIQEIKNRRFTLKGTEFNVFDANFITNINLPLNIGLGKSVSKGFGILTRSNYD